jgi:hypothetical protein
MEFRITRRYETQEAQRKAERRRGERRRTTLKRNPGVLSSVGLEHVNMKTRLESLTCGNATALAEKPGKRRNITRWREARRRRLECERQPTEMQLARMEMLDRQLDGEAL